MKSETTIENKAHRWETALRLAPEAFRDAADRYPLDVEGALTFFGYAIGLGVGDPTEADIEWAQEALKRHGR